MDLSQKILSDVTIFGKYARYDHSLQRRETWEEICSRNKTMHLKKYPQLKDEIEAVYERSILPKKVLPSMRSLQFAGLPIERNPTRIYNCAYLPVEDLRAFSETMFLLLSGTGVGYSVQFRHTNKLPIIIGADKKERRFVIGDSIEGWADAVRVLVEAYYKAKARPDFDYSGIRDKGTELVVSGGKAPGPEPLKSCLNRVEQVLIRAVGRKLKPIEAHDIQCFLADAVLAGGIRRAAMIALFSYDDEEMLMAKSGEWYNDNPQRGRANNSVVLHRVKTTLDQFTTIWNKVRASGAGEPGFYWTNNFDWGTNPCCEIALRPYQFCNLTEINASDIVDQQDYNGRARDAAFIGTLQAGYTNFHYLRSIWQSTTETEALIGVGMTGIASGAINELNEEEAANVVRDTNFIISATIGINSAARCTTVKPSGTSSLVVGSSSGIHGWHAPYYLRRLRFGKDETIYKYLKRTVPKLVEDEFFSPNEQAVISVPQKAPEKATFRDEGALRLLERVSRYNNGWVKTGHNEGDNRNNVSVTVSIKENEWDEVGQWMWANKHDYNGIAVLPYDGGSYKQTPFEDIDQRTYERLAHELSDIDLTRVKEFEDNTDLTGESACAGGACEVDFDQIGKE